MKHAEQEMQDHFWTDIELRDLAESITYKPEFELRLQNHQNMPVIRMVVLGRTWDSRAPDSVFQLIFEHTLYQHISRKRLVESIRRSLHELEVHEADEWFRIDGQLVHDPHK